MRCASCGQPLPAGALDCYACHSLVHSATLDALAQEARSLEGSGQTTLARDRWQQVVALLPAESQQAAWTRQRLEALGGRLDGAASAAPRPENAWARKLGPLGPVAVLAVKAKAIFAALFKLKFLLSLFSFVGIYWALYGWKFGIGFAAAILIHEMGHFIDIKRRGWPAEMPVFLPGLGAYVRWQAMGVTLKQRAQVSLAGPLAGWLAAVLCAVLYHQTGSSIWAGLARIGAALNVLNLIPVWILDGGQAANALGRPERMLLLGAALALWLVTGEGIFFLVAAGTMWRIVVKDGAKSGSRIIDARPARPDWSTLAYYVAVLAALALVLHTLPGKGLGRF